MSYLYYSFCSFLFEYFYRFCYVWSLFVSNEYYVMFLVISFIFMIQVGVPIIIDYFYGVDEDL